LFIEAGLFAADLDVVAYGLFALGVLCLTAGYLSWWRPLAQVWDILTAFVGTGLGVIKSLRGHRFQTWTPAASLRK